MQPLQNDRLLKALLREPVDVTPVWMMRQAGRYLPEYRKVRTQAGSFMDLCTNPELACEVTLQPVERFPLDAAILFSDILTIPDAMGLGLYFEEGEGPRFSNPVRSEVRGHWRPTWWKALQRKRFHGSRRCSTTSRWYCTACSIRWRNRSPRISTRRSRPAPRP
jgi:hypothetical protein